MNKKIGVPTKAVHLYFLLILWDDGGIIKKKLFKRWDFGKKFTKGI